MYKYSKSKSGFFHTDIHGDNIPDDAVDITDGEHAELMAGQSEGKLIQADGDGRPFLCDRPGPTDAELLAQRQREARAYLAGTDWYVTRMAETGKPIPPDVMAQRAASRELL